MATRWNGPSTQQSYARSRTLDDSMFELPNVVRNTLEGLPGIVQVLLLKRESNPKIFVVTDGKDLDRDREIVERLVQIEGIRSAIPLNYDVVTKERAHLIPAGARSVAD